MKETDVLIIGAGAAGISAALYLKRANVPFLWIDKGAAGGKLLEIHEIANYPGLPPMSGTDLADHLLESTNNLGVKPSFGNVVSIRKEGDSFITSTNKEEISSKAVLVATGLSHVANIKGEKDHIGRGVSYCATCDGLMYRNKEAIVYGRGDRVLNEALYLSGVVKHLYLVTPDKEYVGDSALFERTIEKDNVTFIKETEITEILGEKFVDSAKALRNGEETILNADVIFPLLSEKSATEFLSPLGVEMERGFIIVNPLMESSVPGLFASGDIVKKDLRQVVTACSDGAIASTGIIRFLRKRK